tara:strand:+ start:106 stop:384 length:279 start_codon:yes stop_codon:yes gene_type:complete
MRFEKLILFSPIFIFINFSYAEVQYSEKNSNSIIKFFCIESVKSEYKINNVEYQDILGEKICNCYLNNISNNLNHENSISNCKIEINEQNKL